MANINPKTFLIFIIPFFCQSFPVSAAVSPSGLDGDGRDAASSVRVQIPTDPVRAMPPSNIDKAKLRINNINLPVARANIRLSYKFLSDSISGVDLISKADRSAPLFYKQGSNIVFKNAKINYFGIKLEPVITLRPYLEAKNRLAIKCVNIDSHLSMAPTRGGNANSGADDLMQMLVTNIMSGVNESINKAFSVNKVPLKAEDILAFSYDKDTWVIHIALKPNFIAPMMKGLFTSLSLDSFSFGADGIQLGCSAGQSSALNNMPEYTLAVTDRLVDDFTLQLTKGSDFTLHPDDYYGGLKFSGDGSLQIAGKIYAGDITFKPTVYFTATLLPKLAAPNTVDLSIQEISVDKAFSINIPGFINSWLQKKLASVVIDGLMSNQDLKSIMSAEKLSKSTVRITLKSSAFMPAMLSGAVINKLKIADGAVYIGLNY